MIKRGRVWGWILALGVTVAAAGLAYLWAIQESPIRRRAWVAVSETPAASAESARLALVAAGYSPVGVVAWAGEGPRWRTPGLYRLFFTSTSPGANADGFAVDVYLDGDGGVARLGRTYQLTDTPDGTETAPVLAGVWLAFATRVGDRYQSVACMPLGDPEDWAIFALDRPAEQVMLNWRSSERDGPPELAVAVVWPAGEMTFVIDPASSHVEPVNGGLTHQAVVRGEQAWLPNLVSRVRELPFVGPEKIAFLENLFFTLTDRVAQFLHRAPGGQTPSSVQPPVGTALRSPRGASTGLALPAEPPATEPPTAGASDLPEVTLTRVLGEAAPSAVVTELTRPSSPDQPMPATALPTTATQPSMTAQSIPQPSRVLAGTAPPSSTPAGASIAEGVWRRPTVRPDPQRPYAEVEIIEIDPALLQIKMIPGTIEPKPSTGLVGSGVIPKEDWPQLVASFNGGFAAMHGRFGMMVERKIYLPPRDGIATLAVYDDGSLQMGTWGHGLTQTADMVSFRQNCPPLIENGMITAETGKLTLWGLSVSNEVYLYRSGLGLTRDGRLIYAAGRHLSAYTLARALQMAGVVYAMQLDVDEYHVAFVTYDVQQGKPGQEPAVAGRKLRNDMAGFDGLFLRPFQLDFFYLVHRPQPLVRSIRPRETGDELPSPGAARVPSSEPATRQSAQSPDGEPHQPEVGRLAFASNRDGNWEIYDMLLAQPTSARPEARRLTDHPADDLYPAWSPDGRQLAFTSRRDGNAEIYVLNLSDGTLRRVTREASEEWAPAWSPDGGLLAYQSDRNGQSDIYVSAVDGSSEQRLTPYEGNHEAPHWSPDGLQIVFDSDLDVGEAVHASINVYFMNADGSKPRRFMPYAESPAWSLDGRTIAFNATRDGHWQVLTIDTDGGGLRQLTQGAYDARYPAWSPDSRWLAFAGNAMGRWDLYVAPASGGQPILLTDGPSDNSLPAWGPP